MSNNSKLQLYGLLLLIVSTHVSYIYCVSAKAQTSAFSSKSVRSLIGITDLQLMLEFIFLNFHSMQVRYCIKHTLVFVYIGIWHFTLVICLSQWTLSFRKTLNLLWDVSHLDLWPPWTRASKRKISLQINKVIHYHYLKYLKSRFATN